MRTVPVLTRFYLHQLLRVFARAHTAHEHSHTRSAASVWAPNVKTSWFSNLARPHEYVVLGHYASENLKQPKNSGPRMLHRTIEVIDTGALGITGSDRHWRIINHLLPHPALFQLVWEKRGGKRDLYVWRPIPEDPRRFVALGHIATDTDEEPALESVRMVPRNLVIKAKAPPRLLFEDSGTKGRKGSLWRIGNMGMMFAVTGHDAPAEEAWDMPLNDDNAWLASSDGGYIPQ